MEPPLLYNDDKQDNLFTVKYLRKLCSEFPKRKIMHIKAYGVQTYPRVCRQNNKNTVSTFSRVSLEVVNQYVDLFLNMRLTKLTSSYTLGLRYKPINIIT